MNISKQSTERSSRLKALFAMTPQVRKADLCAKYEVSIHTLNAWLSGSRLLSEKGAIKLIQSFRQEGWFVSPEWLLSGKGLPPTPLDGSRLDSQPRDVAITAQRHKDEDFAIAKEVAFFRNANPKSLLLVVSNDAMQPHFSLGDYVGGLLISPSSYERMSGRVCIVDVENMERSLYILHKGDKPGKYTLAVSNMQTKVGVPIVANITPINVAPVVWQRKPLGNLVI